MSSSFKPQLIEKAKRISLLILDVDGVLTDGRLYYAESNEATSMIMEMKSFHVHDGLAIKAIQKCNIPVAIISGRTSSAVGLRAKELDINYCFLNQKDKTESYQKLKQIYNLSDDACAYMGDDYPDLPLLKKVGLAAAPAEPPEGLIEYVDIITKKPGGHGAVREFIDLILSARGEDLSQLYMLK